MGEMDDDGLENLSDTVLYDVFHETSIQMVGYLNLLEDRAEEARDEEAASKWGDLQSDIYRLRNEVDPDDRAAQIAQTRLWRSTLVDLGWSAEPGPGE